MHGTRNKDAAAAGEALGHQDGFGSGRGTVVHGSVGDFLASELAHQALKLEDGLQSALRDFGLIGSVGSEKFAALDDGVGDDGAKMIVNPRTKETGVTDGIFRGARFEEVDDFGFGERAGQIQSFAKTVTLGNT